MACLKLDKCDKVKMVLDKDLLEFQYAEAIRDICAKCDEKNANIAMAREQIRDLVKRYALACNAMLEFERSNITDLYQQLWGCYLAGQTDMVIAVTQELASSDELPEPVCSYWREGLAKVQAKERHET